MSSSSQAPQKMNKGRRKVMIQKIENESHLQVTFCKRRAGIFKKASELCVLCAAEALIVVFSPARKAFSYGHPDVERIVNRFLNGEDPDPAPANAGLNRLMEARRNSNIRSRNLELTGLNSFLAVEKKRGKELDVAKKIGQKDGWIPPPFEGFSSEQLKVFEKAVSNYQSHFDEVVAKFTSLNLNPFATSDMNVINNIGSSGFDPNNNPSLPHGLNNVATGINNTGLYSTGGTSTANNMGEVIFSPELNSWVAGFCATGAYATGEASGTNNVATVSMPHELNNWMPSFGDTGAFATGATTIANNVGAVTNQNEFNNWAPSPGNTRAFATGETTIANNVGTVPDQNEFYDWSSLFGDSGALATGETIANNVPAVSMPPEFNNWAQGSNDTGAFATGWTSLENNFGAQDPYDPTWLFPNDLLPGSYDTGTFAAGGTSTENNFVAQDPLGLVPNELLTGSYDPNAPNGLTDPYNLPGDSIDAMFFGGSGSGVFPGFDDSSGPSQF